MLPKQNKQTYHQHRKNQTQMYWSIHWLEDNVGSLIVLNMMKIKMSRKTFGVVQGSQNGT